MASVAPRRPVGRPTVPGPQSTPAGPPSVGRGSLLPNRPAAAALPLVALGGVLAWWGWKTGAYFGTVFLPGAMVLLLLLAALLFMAPWPAALRGPTRIAVIALLGLSGWTLLSALWSPTPDVAIADTQRALTYTAAFVLGVWLCLLLGPRMLLALGALAGAGAVVGIASLAALWTGDDAFRFFHDDATLRFPLGYRNAAAAFFIMALWPALVLAASRGLDWRLRGALLGTATLMIELAILAQSRGSIFAAVIGVAVLVAAHPARLRILGWLAMAAIPAALALPWLLEVYQHGGGNTAESIAPLHTACAAIAATSLLAVLVGSGAALMRPRELSAPVRRRIGGALLACLGVVLLGGVLALARADGGPIGFFDRHIDELSAGSPDLSSQGSRFGIDLRTNRGDFWRVAIDDFESNPVAGTGAGGFRSSYLVDRDQNSVQPEDPHSVELLMASELGLPGLLLFLAFVVAAVLAVLRARRLGPSAAALSAAALAIGAYWLVHASAEWFWSYPAITMPMAFAAGAAAAPAVLRPMTGAGSSARVPLAIAVVLITASIVPFFLSERLTNDALRTWSSDRDRAYSELRTASQLNPTSFQPLLAEAVIAETAGDRQRALAALDRAERRAPDEWTLYYVEARVVAPVDPAGAARALAEAKALNPRGAEIDELAAQLDITP
jgi:O-Antigen ligase